MRIFQEIKQKMPKNNLIGNLKNGKSEVAKLTYLEESSRINSRHIFAFEKLVACFLKFNLREITSKKTSLAVNIFAANAIRLENKFKKKKKETGNGLCLLQSISKTAYG